MDPSDQQGLYRPQDEHDACGVGFVAHIKGARSHSIVRSALDLLINLEHRGACGSDPDTGDGAGILLQIPDRFFRKVAAFALPEAGEYGAGLVFLPHDQAAREHCKAIVERIVGEEGQVLLGWREVPTDLAKIGQSAASVAPVFEQLFVGPDPRSPIPDPRSVERKLYIIRKRIERESKGTGLYICGLSSRTLIYKGMLTASQIEGMFPDLSDADVESALALVHQRFSTNTFPSWPLAHPYRYVAHNGEINTLRGNINWMKAREGLLKSSVFGDDLQKVLPVIAEGGSDTATFDNVLEFLVMAGRSLPHAVLMMIPEPWSGNPAMDPAVRAFYEYHSSIMEPWDGPASISFTDGRLIGAVLDRNGLRPSRYCITTDDLVIMASEVGVLDIPADRVVVKDRLRPGKMLLIDTVEGRIISDTEIKQTLAAEHPYGDWLRQHLVDIEDLPTAHAERPDHLTVLRRQQAFGYTQEDLRLVMTPMALNGEEPLGSMGTDTALAVLSNKPRLLYDYFKQLFAQVTNPPLDAIREELVTSMGVTIGAEDNLLEPSPEACRQIKVDFPVLHNDQVAKLRHLPTGSPFRSTTLPLLYDPEQDGPGLERAMEQLCRKASVAVDAGVGILILSDRGVDAHHAPIPSLLAVAGVHHHLVREGTRHKCGLLIETGEAREVHHIALLLGYGAGSVNPYLAFESLDDLIRQGLLPGIAHHDAVKRYIKALNKGVLKVMSKMGISTLQSYCGAQIFEAIGLDRGFVEKFFTSTSSKIGGVGVKEISEEVRQRHARAFGAQSTNELQSGGEYQWRRDGELHLFNPDTVFKLQHATRSGQYNIFKQYTQLVNDQSQARATLRGLFGLKPFGAPVPLEEVEPIESILRRFSTGAMSYGSISQEAHETLAIAMNRMGAKSNTGEGGEDPARYVPDANGDSRRSAIKQVASGRFGVTSEYLVNADDLQIKMAQGAKPGEGGQLPGHKVYPWIAKVRHSTPGVGLISPPPHHDIYSIEDLSQLIFDLKNANPAARVHVKLVAESGVGTVAAGVSKAHADVVLISGHDGGTGASPLTSLKHAGVPWELGLAETQQVLLMNRLRDRIVVQVDGQMKTGRDVVVAALLGAEEFGFATAPLVVMGCVMMRVCHLNTCPVGIATQDPELRKTFNGKPEFVQNFFKFIAEEVRELMAELGFRTLNEMIGRAECIDFEPAKEHWKAHGLDLAPVLFVPNPEENLARHNTYKQDSGLAHVLDHQLIEGAMPALDRRTPVEMSFAIHNTDRTAGTMLGYEVTRRFGGAGLPDDTIRVSFTGSAGQSFGAFVPAGITLALEGEANDFVGKGLSGGRLIVRPPRNAAFAAEENVIIGNVALYGATSGEAFISGIAGERFAVRNSGAHAVVEGVGDHACEYMTGGRVIVLGPTGRNFAAGMSGGIAYVLDTDGSFALNCNIDMVDLERLDHPDEVALVRDLIGRHVSLTGSAIGQRVLDAWPLSERQFVAVMPRDFKRVKAAEAKARSESREPAFSDLVVGKATGFIEHARVKQPSRPVTERVGDYRHIYYAYPADELTRQASRCMDCGIPFCHQGCPLGNLIPDWNDLVYRDNWRTAIDRLHQTNNFPEFTGLLCPAPCEGSCVLGINKDPVTIKSIELSIVDRAFDEGWIVPRPPAARTWKKVAVIGSGPAGLAAAAQLNRAGHSVTVFEKSDRIGGLLRYGIPEFKLEKRVLNRRLDLLTAEGVVFRARVNVGDDVSVHDLKREFDAVLLAGGAGQPRDLSVPGRDLKGVHFAMDFLTQQNRHCEGNEMPWINAAGKHVVIIGGGDTGADCLGTVHRQGAASVAQLELMPTPPPERATDNPWPTWPHIFRTTSAHEEGGDRVYAVETTHFAGENGRVRELHGRRVSRVMKDGRVAFEPVAGGEFEMKADLVLLAMGFAGAQKSRLLSDLDVRMTERGNVWRDAQWMTSVPGVFAAGDMQRGQSLIVWAIDDGRRAAAAIDSFVIQS